MKYSKFAKGLSSYSLAECKPSTELPDDVYPIILSTGRILHHFAALDTIAKAPERKVRAVKVMNV